MELTKGLDIETFLLALRRFSACQGFPATLISDNAKTFRAASKEVRKVIRSDEVLHYLTKNRVTWKFIVKGPLVGRLLEEDGSGCETKFEKDYRMYQPFI